MRPRSIRNRAAAALVAVASLACCTIAAAQPWQSFQQPPYAWKRAPKFGDVSDSTRVALIAVLSNVQPMPREGARVALEEFRVAVAQLVDSSGWTQRVPFEAPPRGRPPVVYFGRPPDEIGDPVWPFWSVPVAASSYHTQVVGAVDPSREWRHAIATALSGPQPRCGVVLTIRVARFRPWGGIRKNRVLLGAGYEVPLERPRGFFGTDSVDVLMLCGALVDSTGTIVRAAAEGVCCSTESDAAQTGDSWRDRPPWMRMIQNRRMLAARRSDLPGEPLAYVVAVKNVLSLLIDRPPRVMPAVESRR